MKRLMTFFLTLTLVFICALGAAEGQPIRVVTTIFLVDTGRCMW